MEYTQEMYSEDLSISKWVYNKYFKSATSHKEDLIQTSIMALWQARLRFDETKGAYSTFAIKTSYGSMQNYFKQENKQSAYGYSYSLDYDDDEYSPLVDRLIDDTDLLVGFDIQFLKNIFTDIINNHRLDTFKKVNKLFLKGLNSTQISKELGISRWCACLYINEFKKILKERLQTEYVA